MDSNGLTPGRIPRNQLQMTSVLAEGRFAVIRKAQLDSGKERSVVAAKALRSKQRRRFTYRIRFIQTD